IGAIACLVDFVPARAAPAQPPCTSCDPRALLDAAHTTLERALRWDAPLGGDAVVASEIAAEETAAGGDTKVAADLARHAAAACVVAGGGPCVEAVELLAELEVGAGDFSDDEVAGMLALAPGKDLPAAVCARAALVRLRLAGRHGDPRWADPCGPEAARGELGYRAAKAALLRGDRDGARARLDALSDAPRHEVRAQYLAAVVDVADGRIERARDELEALTALAPDPDRSAEDDEARALAQLQLARVERELGRPDLALDAYRSVPAQSRGRPDALVEGAATAAFLGDAGLARAYLGAIEIYGPTAVSRTQVLRLRTSIDLTSGDESAASAGFLQLERTGREMRARLLPDEATAAVALAADPSLGGLLDPHEQLRLLAVEQELGTLVVELDRNEREIARLTAIVHGDGPHTDARRALEHVREADRLLRMAEAALGLDVGPRVAGPARPSTMSVDAKGLRISIDAADRRLAATCAREKDEAAVLLVALDGDVADERGALAHLASTSRPLIEGQRQALLARAERVVRQLEMAGETGALEIVWNRKMAASKELRRLTLEQATDRKDLEESR
ncbi:MAG TPA: hypothetical protein VGO62_03195, partial [Myxococcota bacterium]